MPFYYNFQPHLNDKQMTNRMVVLVFLLFWSSPFLLAQHKEIDSLWAVFKTEKTDTGKIVLLYNLSYAYRDSRPDSALLLAQKAYYWSKERKFLRGESWAL